MTGAAVGQSVSWGVVVPVKHLSVAKSRLSPYGDQVRRDLALAFASDVVRAALEVAHVLVVTDDPQAADALVRLGAQVVADDPDSGLNPALVHGAELLRSRDPEAGVATVSADLAALRSDDLRAALSAVDPGTRGFVVDRAGTGTTLLAAGPGADLSPAFGADSRRAHRAGGADELVVAPGLRCDVDTAADLIAALALGAGPATASVVAALGLGTVQATVRTWDDGEGGSVFLADGSIVPVPRESLAGSGFRFLRVGQRIRLVRQDGTAVALGLP